MAKAIYWQRGESLDYTNGGAAKIDANTIIDLGACIGIAGTDIAVGETGSLHVVGVFECPKSSSNKIELGTKVYFDGTGITEAANDGEQVPTAYTPVGYAVAEAAASATKILVKLLG